MGEVGAEARTGARWWANKIREGFHLKDGAEEYAGSLETRSHGLTGILERSLATKITAEGVDQYERELAQRIQTEIVDAYVDPGKSMTSYFSALTLSIDYGPSQIHNESLAAAGLPTGMGMLPLKTAMWIEPGRVRVGDGYGAAPQDLELVA